MKSLRLVLLAMILVFVIVTVAYMLQPFQRGAVPVCGNDKCENDEGCLTCPLDCVCKNGAYCSGDKCVKTECGDGDCGPGENSGNCCSDCGCIEEGSICESNTQTCSFPEAAITDDEVRQAITEYYTNQSLTVARIEITGSSMSSGEPVKGAFVYIEGEDFERTVSVNEKGEVVQELFRW